MVIVVVVGAVLVDKRKEAAYDHSHCHSELKTLAVVNQVVDIDSFQVSHPVPLTVLVRANL